MRHKKSHAEYLAFLTMKYGVDVDRFFKALVSAGKNRKAECGVLSIECRDKRNKKISLLITQDQKVVAQFQLPEEFLSRRKNPIEEAKRLYLMERGPIRKDGPPRKMDIKDLRIGMKAISVRAKVIEISEPTRVITRFGNYASVANAILSDDTGEIKICLWNEQINSVSVGDNVQIDNARISSFKNERQLRIFKKGTLQIVQAE